MNEYLYDVCNENVKLTGRGSFDTDSSIYWCSLSGSGFECHFKGKWFHITLVGDRAATVPDNDSNWARYAVYVNGVRTVDSLLDNFSAFRTIEVINGDIGEITEADIKFVKLSECAMSNIGICQISCDGEISPLPPKKLKLEFIGDSITCGYGVDEYDPEKHFKTATEDFTKGYAYKTAQLLDADARAFSISGWGIVSGFVDSPDEHAHTDQLIPKYYTKLGFSYEKFDDTDGLAPQDINWDFSEYVPDLIVVNLGTNDNSWCTGHEDRYLKYTEEYAKFLGTVHSCNPTSKILCVMGIMLDDIFPYVEKAVGIFKEQTGFTDIYTLKFTPHDGKLGYGADYHPSPATHDRAAKLLAEKIREIMK